MLLSDDIDVIIEFCRRFTEIQSITLSRCGLTDSPVSSILNTGISQLRHLKVLNLVNNLLKSDAVKDLVEMFGNKSKNSLESLDLRGNALTFEDGFDSDMYQYVFACVIDPL